MVKEGKVQLALKIDVETYRGAREGVPRLLELLKREDVQASFFFALGPDRTGRAINRFFRRGFPGNGSRISLLQHYGIKTLLYGTLFPAPDIGRNCADILRNVRDLGHEVGINCFENSRWQDHAAQADAKWTLREMQLAVDRFAGIFGEPPKAFAAAGWQLNRDSLRQTQRMGFDYASDTRGKCPFIPTWDAEIVACPQLPTTLPTLDEIVGRGGVTPQNAVTHLLKLTEHPTASGHIFTLRAELEGGKWLPMLEQLLQGWREQGYDLLSLRQYLQNIEGTLPRHAVRMGELSGRSGKVAIQI
jgi:peptidoglycan/xylan/chitin deacetylase (PgdA/CDA1 family)